MADKRAEQPRCTRLLAPDKRCNHSASLHGTERSRCRATGCTCVGWLAPELAAFQVVFSDPPTGRG